MIILPNNLERYISALRIYISISILKEGLKPKHLENLRKLYTIEAVLNKNFSSAVNISDFCLNLLQAVKDIKPSFNFKIKSDGNYYINKKLFTVLLLTLCKEVENIKIETTKSHILITVPSKTKSSLFCLKKLKGYFLCEIKSNRFLFLIPCQKTSEKPKKTETEWEYLFDQFSPLNIFFNRIL